MKPTHRINTLTILRGLAAYAVLLSHCLRFAEKNYFGEATVVPPPFRWLDYGTFGVTLFFALSGFTLYTSYGASTLTDMPRYFLRRICRIYPAFVVSLGAYLIIEASIRTTVGFLPIPPIRDFGLEVGFVVLLEYLTLTFNFAGDWFYINNIYWSLPVEFQFYLMLPLFVLTLQCGGTVALLAVAFLLYGASGYIGAKFITFQLAWQFIGGILAAWVFKRVRKPFSQRVIWCGIAVAGVIIVCTHNYMWDMHFVPWMDNYFTGGSSALTYGIAAILLVFLGAMVDGRRFANTRLWRVAMMQGDISYSLYLWHNLALLFGYVAIVDFGLVGWSRLSLVYGVCLPLAYVLAWYSHVWVEKPGIEFGRRLQLGPKRAVGPTVARN
jgi:peptidoglycan/LPS O-acetylase OafA/YrhL